MTNPGDRVVIVGRVQEVAADTAIIALDSGGLAAVPAEACGPPGWTLKVRDALTGEPTSPPYDAQPGIVALVELLRS